MPGHLVDRAANYLNRPRGGQAPEWEVVHRLRKEAEEARAAGPFAAGRGRADPGGPDPSKLADLQTQAENDARISEARARLQPGDRVVVPRFGYDRPGRVVKLDPKKNKARRRHRHDEVGRARRGADPPAHQHPGGPPARPRPGGKATASKGPRLDQF